jgi:hypothetical protein
MLIAWVYGRTRSLLLAQLMHAGFTGGQVLLLPPFYSNDYLENLTGANIHNADVLRPEWHDAASISRREAIGQ